MYNNIYLQWRTSLAISALYTIFQSSSYYTKLFNDDNTISSSSSNDSNDKAKREKIMSSCFTNVTESLSNFYIISTSNKNGILQLVNVLEQQRQVPHPSSSSNTSSKKDNKNVNNNNNSNNSGVFDKSIEYCIYLEEWDNTMNTNATTAYDVNDRYNTKSALATSSSYYQQYYPKLNIGDAIWISFQTLFTISKTLSSTITTSTATTTSLLSTSKRTVDIIKNHNTLLIQKAIFTPSLTLYMHTLRRFPGQKSIVPMALSGFLALANTSLSNGITNSTDKAIEQQRISERNALISSLCKIATDSTTSSSSSSLRDYQIESLSCLFYIIHIHFNAITSKSDWNSVIYTLHQLSSLSLGNNYYLSKDMYPTSMALSIAMTRLSNFSKCFNNQCFICFLEACMELSFALFRKNNNTSSAMNSNDNNVNSLSANDDEDNHFGSGSSMSASTTLGNKIFSLAGRAFGGVSSTITDNADDPSTPTSAHHHHHRSSERKQQHSHHHSPSPTPSISKRNFGDDARQSILSNIINITQSSNAITTSSSSSIISDATSFTTRSTGSTKGQQPIVPLSLLLLVDCTLVNIYRFDDFGDIVIPHLCDIAALYVDVRQFVIDIVCHFILTRLSKQTDDSNNGTTTTTTTMTMTMPEELLLDENKEKNNLKRIPKGNPTPEYYFVYEEVIAKYDDDSNDRYHEITTCSSFIRLIT